MKILKATLGAIEVIGGVAVEVVGGTLEYVCNAIGANAPGQSFSEWEESQNSFDNLAFDEMYLVKAGDKLFTKGIETFKQAVQ